MTQNPDPTRPLVWPAGDNQIAVRLAAIRADWRSWELAPVIQLVHEAVAAYRRWLREQAHEEWFSDFPQGRFSLGHRVADGLRIIGEEERLAILPLALLEEPKDG